MNYSFPQIYGIIKMHKENQPMSSVVAFNTDSSYKLAKHLVQWFRTVIDYKS